MPTKNVQQNRLRYTSNADIPLQCGWLTSAKMARTNSSIHCITLRCTIKLVAYETPILKVIRALSILHVENVSYFLRCLLIFWQSCRRCRLFMLSVKHTITWKTWEYENKEFAINDFSKSGIVCLTPKHSFTQCSDTNRT